MPGLFDCANIIYKLPSWRISQVTGYCLLTDYLTALPN